MARIERIIERILLASRWLLVVFYIGLGIALAAFGVAFVAKLWVIVHGTLTYTGNDMLLDMLGLIDAVLVASLLLMVMLSGYESFVSRIDRTDKAIEWLTRVGMTALKVKMAAAIVVISLIHLLEVFFNIDKYSNDKVLLSTLLHLIFVATAFVLARIEWKVEAN